MTNSRATSRRFSLAIIVVIAIVAAFVVRLSDLQVVNAGEYNAASLDKRAVGTTTYGMRGQIVDTNGVVLADTVLRYDIQISPKLLFDPQKNGQFRDTYQKRVTNDDGETERVDVDTREAFAKFAEITGTDADKILEAVFADTTSDYLPIAKDLDTEQYRAVRELSMPWTYGTATPNRTYPAGAVAGNLIGFMGTDKALAGIELAANDCLQSTDGTSTYERGLDGVRLPGSTVTTQDAIDGGSVKLTIDSDLQWFVQQALAEQSSAVGAESATATVVRVADGHIMAMADWPSVDPNNFAASPDNLGALSFQAAYEQGSTFKPMSAAMLIEEGVATPTTQLTIPSIFYTPEGGRVRDVTPHGELHMTLTGVIRDSSNIGISMLSRKLPNSTRYDYFTKFGIGEKTAVGFPGEQAGILAETWDSQQQYDVSFGQGVSSTLAQMGSVYQTLGNGGTRLPLTLVESCTTPEGVVITPKRPDAVKVVSESTAKQVVEMMESVVTGSHLRNVLKIPGYRVAAKSGTAQMAEGGRYTDGRVVSVAGLAPAEAPEYAVIVELVKPVTMRTSAAAAPVFTEIMTQVLKAYRVEPSTTPPSDLPATW